jgi:hypothetical protein
VRCGVVSRRGVRGWGVGGSACQVDPNDKQWMVVWLAGGVHGADDGWRCICMIMHCLGLWQGDNVRHLWWLLHVCQWVIP